MTVYGVSNATASPVAFTSQDLRSVQQPVAAVSVGTGEPVAVSDEEQTKSSARRNFLLTLATLGVITYGVIRYRNAKALKPIVENFEKATKDGGKLTTQLTKTKVQNPDGTTTQKVLKSVKTHYDKDGKKHAEIIHDFTNSERYTVFYDRDGNVTKNVVSRMSVPTKGAQKAKVEQQIVNVYTRNNNQVTTNTTITDYGAAKAQQIYSFSKTEPLQPFNT